MRSHFSHKRGFSLFKKPFAISLFVISGFVIFKTNVEYLFFLSYTFDLKAKLGYVTLAIFSSGWSLQLSFLSISIVAF